MSAAVDRAARHLALNDGERWENLPESAKDHYREAAEGWPRTPASHEIAKYRELARPGMKRADRAKLKRAVIRASDSGEVPF